jgi:hypothetical protein
MCDADGRAGRGKPRPYRGEINRRERGDWVVEALVGTCQVAEVDVGGVFEADMAVLVVIGEDFL